MYDKNNSKNKNDFELLDLRMVNFVPTKCYIVFGFGYAGTAIAWYIKNIKKLSNYAFCDSDINKQSDKNEICIYSVEDSIQQKDNVFLVGFMDNDESKLKSAVACLKDNEVSNDRIIFIDMNSIWFDEICESCTKELVSEYFCDRSQIERINKVDKIIFLSDGFSQEVEKKPGGGPIGAINMQKKYLGDKFYNFAIEYPYYQYQFDKELIFNKYCYIINPVNAVNKIVKSNRNTIYIANDIFSAFALYVLGKKYCLIFHGQGDIVQEWSLWGRVLSEKEKVIIREIECITIKNACLVSFPSIGAKEYFEQSLNKFPKFNNGMPLYNTVFDFPVPESIGNIKQEESKITFLSIGQFTWLKGMDRIPEFIEQYINYTGKNVRWIVVADGILKEKVAKKMRLLEKTGKVEYINIDYKISHAQVFYLLSICNVYLMLHRVSIFDFSTLEAMYCNKAIILTDIPGNDEFNKENNIMLVKDTIEWITVCDYIENSIYYGNENKRIYNKHFSESPFIHRYSDFFEKFISMVEQS
jgi:glycosyltransferase involved in cell wall biosynthesis